MSATTVKEAVFGGTGKAVAVAALCACAGLGVWIAMMNLGLATTTAMGNIFNWGLLIAVFAFLVGFGAGAQLVASGIVLFGRPGSQRLVLPLQACGLGAVIGAAVAVMADLGAPFHIFAMVLHPNPASPLVWDMVALTAFIVLAFVGLLAVARGWRSRRVWMAVAGVAAVALQVVEGLLFALMGARAWWHSVLEPVDFLVVALVCGFALAVLLGACFKRSDGLEAAISMARWLFWAVLVHVALSLGELGLLVSEQTAGAQEALALVGSYGWLYALELGLPLVAVVVLRVRLREAGRGRLVVCALLVTVGMFAHRLMLLYPALGAGTLFIPLSDAPSPSWLYPVSTGYPVGPSGHVETFSLLQAYVPTGLEWLAVLLPVGLAVLVALVAYNVARAVGKAAAAE